ncbi:MAG: beta strand repeat-containing protein, partial [Flavobacterium sp.]
MKKNIFYTLCLLFLVGNLYSQQTVWVKAGGTGDGSSEATAYGSFTTAFGQIDSAGDVLRVVGNVPASGQSLNKNFAYTIEGDAGGSTLTGTAGATRMFTNNAAGTGSQNVTFKNIKFTGATGSIGTGGGGVLYSNIANTINFENCRFEGNSLVSTVPTGGGALFITLTTVTITDCLFKENTALSKGGAISLATGANVTLTRCTFYKNSTTSATGNLNAAALWVVAGAVVNGYNCTFFQNTTGATNQDYGVIRSDGGTTKLYNSLFYDNKLNTNVAAPGDWGSAASIGSTLTNSLAQRISANVTNTSSTVSTTIALASSNLTYDDTSGKVRFSVAAAGDVTPIAFGSDGKDVGAWNCGTRVTPTFTQVAAICSGATLSALPTTSNNGITGTWSPALDNTTTTTYTFLPGLGQCALSTTMTITVNPSTTTGSVIVSQNTPYTWAENNVTYTQTTTTSITTGCNTATLNFTLLGASAPTISTLTSNGTTVITQGCGGSTLIITGTDFSGASVVTVNGVAVASFTVNSSTQITAILSPGPVSSGAVAVTTPAGTGTSAGNFAVNAQVTPTFTQVAAICPGESLSALPTTSNNSITGTWSPALNNAATTTYTFTPTAGQCATTATMTITVNSGVTPTFTQVATICLGASLSALPTTSNNSITGTWSPALNNAATTVYTFTPDAGQCASTATMTITVNASCTKTFTWNGSASNDWATAANWTTTGDGPDTFPGQTKTTDIVVISNGGTPVIASGTYGIISLAINNASGATTGSILTINSGATLTVNNTAVVAITLKGGSIVNNGTLNATSTNVGASFGIACQVPSVAPSSATEYGYSGSGALNINTSASTNASSGGIQFSGTAANTTYKMLFNGATTFSLNNTALAVYALRVVDGAKNPIIIGGTGFTLGTVGAPVNYGLLIMGNNGNDVTVDTGTTLTLNSAATNTGASCGIACLVPSVAPSSAKEYGYSGSGALNISTTLGNASSGGIQF